MATKDTAAKSAGFDSESSFEYVPYPHTKLRLPRIFLGKGAGRVEVVLGGTVTIPAKPHLNKPPREIPEATPAQYKEAYELGYTSYIEKRVV